MLRTSINKEPMMASQNGEVTLESMSKDKMKASSTDEIWLSVSNFYYILFVVFIICLYVYYNTYIIGFNIIIYVGKLTIRKLFDGSSVPPVSISVPRVFAPVPAIRTKRVGTYGITPRRIPSTPMGSANIPTYIYISSHTRNRITTNKV